MDPGFALRDARPGDEPTLVRFIHALAAYENLSHQVVISEDLLRVALFGPHPQAEALIVEMDALAVGYALWFTIFDSFTGRSNVFVEDAFVLASARGKGIGRAMFRAIGQRALQRGYTGVAWKVLDWNTPSIGFYRSLGATPNPGWTTYTIEGPALTALAA